MTAAEIKAKAKDLGFDLCGIAPATDLPELHFFERWLARDRCVAVRDVLPGLKSSASA